MYLFLSFSQRPRRLPHHAIFELDETRRQADRPEVCNLASQKSKTNQTNTYDP